MTFPDWREPVRLLRLGTRPATPEQLDLAAKVGLQFDGEVAPHDVIATMIEEYLMPALWSASPEPCTERQRAFLRTLGSPMASEGTLTKAVASAWIEHHLALRTIVCLESLQLRQGDPVIKRTTWAHPATGDLRESLDYYVVSSIGSHGLVYFKGGNGKCGWPANVRRGDGEDPSTYPRFGYALGQRG